ncbi:MAG TPA: 3-phosphoshikimate 1-carboxyvinyltransferase [Acholeplasma sp.]|nr:3-phosphoshikimate 1-carboxyvinyltransferase [Acholeplasma sp.]
MDIVLSPRKLEGSLSVISSKSMSHRYLIAASLANGTSTVGKLLDSDDITATKNALKNFGVRFEMSKVFGGFLKPSEHAIDCNESGSTLRFLIPFAWLFNKPQTFIGRGKLPKRSLKVYENIAKTYNYQFDYKNDFLPLETSGPLKAGDYYISGDTSSQFVTGLLFVLPLLKDDSRIIFTSTLESKDYAIMTIETMKAFGVHVMWDDKIIKIKGNQTYIPKDLNVEGDYSQAAFYIVAGLINGNITLSNLDYNSFQGDKAILNIIRNMGAKVTIDGEYLKITKQKTYGTTIDLKDIPDLGPILMVLASLSKGKTTFINIERLRIKESDRVLAMQDMLTRLGVDIKVYEDKVIIDGKELLEGGVTVDSYLDHRIAMAASIIALRCKNPITLTNAEVVKKSYPTFYEDYQSLGGEIYEIR